MGLQTRVLPRSLWAVPSARGTTAVFWLLLGEAWSSHFSCLLTLPALGFHFPNKEAALDSLLRFPEPVVRARAAPSLCPAAGECQEVVMTVRAMLVRHPQCPGDSPGRRTDMSGHYRSHPGQQPLSSFLDRTTSCEFVTLWSVSEAVGLGCFHSIPRHGWLRPWTLVSHTSESWEVQDHDVSRFGS